MIEIEGFIDCSCVWAYVAFKHAARLSFSPEVTVRWRPVLVQEIFEKVNHAVGQALPQAKQAYYQRDLRQWAEYLELPLAADAKPPKDAADCMLACVAADRLGALEPFASAAMNAAWAEGRDLADRKVLAEVWAKAGLPAVMFESSLDWSATKAELVANTRELMARGGFGVPTFFIGHSMYFGNDSLPLVERAVRMRLRLNA
jgi:2-hydroxychromene-2-carboxylate isomerase